MDVLKINAEVLKKVKAFDYAGYDPFDALNSKFFDFFPSLKKGIFGLAWTQINKRSMVNFRPLLCVPKKRNPKGIGLFILGLIEDYKRTNEQAYLDEAKALGQWLLSQQSDRSIWQHACWGYHFDWNARAFFVAKGKPNIITTVYVAQALYALGKVTNDDKFTSPALDAANFIVNTLYTKDCERAFFAYIPQEKAFVHNASLWGAAWVAFVANETKNSKYQKLAINVARQSVSEQCSDGSWVYGARSHHQFIDGFHTGYNLEALHMIEQSINTGEFQPAIDKGLAFYKTALFTPDGTAKYFHNNQYPLDMHCVAQAILTFLKISNTQADIEFVEKVINQSIENLYMPSQQRFMYQKFKTMTNKINYTRWTQAWVYFSFAYYNRVLAEQNN